tara:strand:+ start:1696 stop:2007 length:312 start_codon:yes stop_codon:yes gene_type:complete
MNIAINCPKTVALMIPNMGIAKNQVAKPKIPRIVLAIKTDLLSALRRSFPLCMKPIIRRKGMQNKYRNNKIANTEVSADKNLTKVAIAIEKITSKIAVNIPSL